MVPQHNWIRQSRVDLQNTSHQCYGAMKDKGNQKGEVSSDAEKFVNYFGDFTLSEFVQQQKLITYNICLILGVTKSELRM